MIPQAVEYDPHRLVLEAVQAGDAHAMAELIRAQETWVRGVILGVLGRADELDDVAQRVWIKVWQQARKLEDSRRWRPWLYQIARNTAMDSLRAGQRRKWLQRAWRMQRTTWSAAPADRPVAQREREAAMLKAISELPELYREPFVLRHVENWSYAQIAATLGLRVDTVETRLVRARRLLREKLAAVLDEPRNHD